MTPKPLRFRWLVDQVDTRNSANVDYPLMSVSQYVGVIPRSELKGDEGRAESLDNYKICLPGEIVINRMSASSGALGIAKTHGLVSPDYAVLKVTELAHPQFIEYLMKSSWFVGEMVSRLRGIGAGGESASVRTPRINIDDLGNILVNLPSIEEQRRIADYLDKQTKSIDLLIDRKKQQNSSFTEWLAARKNEEISGRTTLARIETGLPWMPLAPAHWKRLPLRSLVSWRKGIDSARLSMQFCDDNQGEFPVYSGQTDNAGIFASISTYDFNFNGDCLLLSTVGAQAGRTRIITGKFSLSQNCAIMMKRSEEINLKYLDYLWDSLWTVMKSEIPSDMQPSVRFTDLAQQWIFLPMPNEQQEIVDRLISEETVAFSRNQTIGNSILNWIEYKSALITAAVTGSFDVTTGRSVV